MKEVVTANTVVDTIELKAEPSDAKYSRGSSTIWHKSPSWQSSSVSSIESAI